MKFFTPFELYSSTTARLNGISNIPGEKELANLTNLVKKTLDPAREALGNPIKVNSGYRCPELNRLVNGSPNSYHLQGRAADLNAGSYWRNKRLFDILSRLPHIELINEQNLTWIHVAL